jgi:hypothetical protein
MSQMTIRAPRGARLLCAAALAWLGLAMCAQAAHATYSKITIVKINQGGNQNDSFAFHPSLTPTAGDFSIKAGEANRKTLSVECNVGSSCISRWGNLTQTISESPTSGYTLTNVTCRHTQGTNNWAGEPDPTSPIDTDTTVDLAAGKITFGLNWWEWVKCYVTNTRDTGTIKVTKKVVAPAGDTGKFNLLVDGQTKATDVGDGGTTGAQIVTTGAHTVGEAAGTGTDLSDYSSSLACKDTAHGNAPDNDGSLQVGKGDAWECVYTNTRNVTPPPPPRTDEPPTTPPTPVVVTATAPKIQVSPARVKPGSAKLSGPSGCPTTSAVAATVTGRRIVKVTFYVDGKKVKTLTKANKSGGRWVLPLNVRRLAFGAHRVQAKIQFAASSHTKPKTLRFSFDRCHAAAARPKFTG